MSETGGRWTAYIMVLFIAALLATGKVQRFDSLWLVFFATMLMLPASADTRPRGGDSTKIGEAEKDGSPTGRDRNGLDRRRRRQPDR